MYERLVGYLKADIEGFPERKDRINEMLAWLEKQGEQNLPLKEIILNVWELGNYWKDLTKGVCNTEHGTQLDYIVKHWKEGECYIKFFEKQGKSSLQWKRIKKGEYLPETSILMKESGIILPFGTEGGIEVGQDAYYLPIRELSILPKQGKNTY